jgi:hypothetical protein
MLTTGRVFCFCHEDDTECYRLSFEIETYLRVVARWELRGRNPADWRGLIPSLILAEAEARQEQERSIGYLDERKSGILSYLNLSELKDLILGPLWPAFRKQWPPEDMVRSEFKKLIAIRNKIAHFRPVTSRDRRVVRRFAEDLADWTAFYRRTAEYATTLRGIGLADKENLKDNNLIGIADSCQQLVESGTAEKYDIALSVRTHHLAIAAKVTAGSIELASYLRFLDAFEKQVSFFRIGDLGEELCCYVPMKIGDDRLLKVMEQLIAVISSPVGGVSGDEVRRNYQVAERENVLPRSIDMPVAFVL